MGYDPFKYLEDSQIEWPEHLDPVNDAQKCYDPHNPDRLIALLRSDDSIVVQRGLAVFGELGDKAFNILDVALAQVHHPNIYARTHLLDGILCYPDKLTASQVGAILPLAGDPKDVICAKVMTILATVELEALTAAIFKIPDSPMRSDHMIGLKYHVEFERDAQSVFDHSFTVSRTISIYMLASLERRARLGIDFDIPIYSGDSYVHKSLLFQLERFVGKK